MKNNHANNNAKNYDGKERRSYVRYQHRVPVHYSFVARPEEKSIVSRAIRAISKNISASGILFSIDKGHMPDLSSILILDLDYRTARVCEALEKRALIVNNKLLGKVVRLQKAKNGEVDVGVAFITKSEDLSEDLRKLIG